MLRAAHFIPYDDDNHAHRRSNHSRVRIHPDKALGDGIDAFDADPLAKHQGTRYPHFVTIFDACLCYVCYV